MRKPKLLEHIRLRIIGECHFEWQNVTICDHDEDVCLVINHPRGAAVSRPCIIFVQNEIQADINLECYADHIIVVGNRNDYPFITDEKAAATNSQIARQVHRAAIRLKQLSLHQ